MKFMRCASHASVPVSLFIFSLLVLPFAVNAAELRFGEQPSVQSNETISEDLYIAGGNVTNSGRATADVVVAGGSILLSGPVGADIAAAGGSITILGDVGDDVRAAGGNLIIQGAIGGDAVLAGGQVTLAGSGVRGGALLAGGSVRVDAPITGDVRIGGGDVYVNSVIGGNVEIHAEQVTLGPNARIAGNLTYTAAREARIEDGAIVSGETVFNKTPARISVAGVAALLTLALLGTFFAQLASALAFGLFFRRYALMLAENAIAKPLLEVGRGLIAVIVLPVVSILLLYTVIGIPLGIFGLISFAGVLVFLWIATPVILGSLAYRSFFKSDFEVSWKTILLGTFIWSVIGLIPIVGWLTQLLLALLTLGVAVKAKWDIAKEWR